MGGRMDICSLYHLMYVSTAIMIGGMKFDASLCLQSPLGEVYHNSRHHFQQVHRAEPEGIVLLFNMWHYIHIDRGMFHYSLCSAQLKPYILEFVF